MEKGVYFPKKMGADKGMILNLLNTDKLGSFIRSDIPGDERKKSICNSCSAKKTCEDHSITAVEVLRLTCLPWTEEAISADYIARVSA